MATVAKSTRRTTITLASDGAGPFDLDFRLFDDDEVVVYVNNVPETGFTLSSSYTDGYDDSATITFDTALESGDVVIIDSNLVPGRGADLIAGDDLLARMNIELGRVWATLADHHRDISRSARLFTEVAPGALDSGDVLMFQGGAIVSGPTAANIAAAESIAAAASASADAAAASAVAAATFDPDNFFPVDAPYTYSQTMTVTGTINISGGTLTFADGQIGGVKVAQATTSVRGTVELSTTGENTTGTDTARVPSVAGVVGMISERTDLVAVEEIDISDDATCDIVLDTATYSCFSIILSHIVPASGSSLNLQCSTDGGSTFDSGASDYSWASKRILGVSADVIGGDAADTVIRIGEVIGDAADGDGLSGQITINFPETVAETTVRFQGEITAGDGTFQIFESGGRHNSAAAVDAIRLAFNSGNIASGKIIVYGYKGAGA